MKLRKCDCGGKGIMSDNSDGDLAYVACDKCGLETLGWGGRWRAERNWNAIQRKLLLSKKEN